MNPVQIAQARAGAIRWHLLATANVSRPQGMYTTPLLAIIQSIYPDATEREIRRELDYLEERELVKIHKDSIDRWMIELARYGIDVVEYTLPCEPGISRPTITQD